MPVRRDQGDNRRAKTLSSAAKISGMLVGVNLAPKTNQFHKNLLMDKKRFDADAENL